MGIIKKQTINNLIISVVFLLLGLMLAFKPDFTVGVIIFVIGGIIIAFGVLKILNHVNSKKDTGVMDFNLFAGIMGVVLGIAIIVFGKTVIALFRIIIGIWIIYNAALKIELTSLLKKSNSKAWAYVCVIAVIMLLCGIYITFNANAIISTIGIVMVAYSVMDLVENIIALKNMKRIIFM